MQQKNHIMGNNPQPPKHTSRGEQNFSTIYGNKVSPQFSYFYCAR